jgi:acyl-CoA thioester hydrolase
MKKDILHKRVFYHDTDAEGVVYYANYLKYLEEARTLFLEKAGINLKELKKEGVLFAVINLEIQYKRPLFYGDEFIIETELVKKTVVRLGFKHIIKNKNTQGLIVLCYTELACIDKNLKARPLPEDFPLLKNEKAQ